MREIGGLLGQRAYQFKAKYKGSFGRYMCSVMFYTFYGMYVRISRTIDAIIACLPQIQTLLLPWWGLWRLRPMSRRPSRALNLSEAEG